MDRKIEKRTRLIDDVAGPWTLTSVELRVKDRSFSASEVASEISFTRGKEQKRVGKHFILL
jgi:hypothetical protein